MSHDEVNPTSVIEIKNNYRTHNHVHIYKKEKQLFNKYIRRLVNSVLGEEWYSMCRSPEYVYTFLCCVNEYDGSVV